MIRSADHHDLKSDDSQESGRYPNSCPRCQTGGRILADRSLSRFLKDDRPRHIDEIK